MRLTKVISLLTLIFAAVFSERSFAQERLNFVYISEMARSRPEVLKYDASTMVDTSIVKAIDEEGFSKNLVDTR